eukprot:gene3192-6301_t
MSEEKMENWKQFHGTELGGLMNQLYGGEKPKINYPKPKKRESNSLPSEPFIPGGARSNSTDPRMSTKRDVHVAVPKLGGKGTTYIPPPMIECIPKRRSETSIKRELDDMKMREMHYRPAHIKPVSIDSEKERFSQVCEYKGGKALPAELIAPARETPLELMERKNEKERIERVRMKRSGGGEARGGVATDALSHNEQLKQQIASEIDERREYLTDMLKMGGISSADESRISNEIRVRIQELTRLES